MERGRDFQAEIKRLIKFFTLLIVQCGLVYVYSDDGGEKTVSDIIRIMEIPMKESLFKALRTQRLCEFADLIGDTEGPCFYIALVNCFDYLYPAEVLPSAVIAELREHPEKLTTGVKPLEGLQEVRKFEPVLKLKIDQVVNHSNRSADMMKCELNIPEEIRVVNSVNGILTPEPGYSTAITYLIRNHVKRGHYMALAEDPILKELEINMGGNTEFSMIKDKYKAYCSFIVVKSGR